MDRPLSGIRVVGMEQYMAAPYCTMLLADAGAEVIKIERTGRGDARRSIPPFAEKDGKRKAGGFMSYNRNKKSFALDVQHPKGGEIYQRLVAGADVVVENARPGSMDKLGLGWQAMHALNPRLVYAAISGFGRMPGYEGPYGNRPAFDIVAEAMSGIMNAVGFKDKPPSWTIYGLADIHSGMVTAWGIMQALFMRERTGVGQLVDSALFDNMLALNERMVTLYSVACQPTNRGEYTVLYPRGAFLCRDGYVALNVPDDIIWKNLCAAIGREDLIDDERSKTGTARAANEALLAPIIEKWLAERTRAEAVDALNAAGVPTGPVYTAEDVFGDPQVAARGMLMPVTDPEIGTHRFARTVPHLSESPELPAEPAPNLGQHTAAIMREILGYDDDAIRALDEEKVIQLGG